MKRLTLNRLETCRKVMADPKRSGEHNFYEINARVEFPLGELISSLAGFAWAWKLKDELPEPVAIEESDRFNAQGIEGKIVKLTNLGTAVVIWAQCRPNRCQVFA